MKLRNEKKYGFDNVMKLRSGKTYGIDIPKKKPATINFTPCSRCKKLAPHYVCGYCKDCILVKYSEPLNTPAPCSICKERVPKYLGEYCRDCIIDFTDRLKKSRDELVLEIAHLKTLTAPFVNPILKCDDWCDTCNLNCCSCDDYTLY